MVKINNLINISSNDGVLVTGSREVALNFEKQHKDVLERVDKLIMQMNSAENSAQYFIPDEYRDSSGKVNRQYLLTRDGFSLLVMGFTGQKALQWKLKYIKAFNKMEAALKNDRFQIEPVQLQCIKETNKTLRFIQDKNLRESIAKQVLSKLYDVELPLENISTTKLVSCDDTVKQFIASQCELIANERVKISALYECYAAWCKLNRCKALSKILFGRDLKIMGFAQGHKTRGYRYWEGIKIKLENMN